MTGTVGVDDLHVEALRVMAAAARRTHEDGSPSDFAEFLANVLPATAANIGGTDQLLVGRPGSNVDADPWSSWWSSEAKVNPRPCDEDALLLELWEAAHDVVALPDVDIQPVAARTDVTSDSPAQRAE